MADEKNFDQEILKKIKEEKIVPKPKWQFLLKEYTVWGFGMLSLLIGGLAFSVIIFMFSYNDWGVYHQIDRSFGEFLLLTLPYFWVVILALFIMVLNYNIRHTKKGYRFSLPVITVATIFLSIVLGIVFYILGMGKAIDDVLGARMPFYEKVVNRQIDFWSQPENGRLAGMVTEVIDGGLVLYDLERNKWSVDSSEAIIIPMAEIVINRPIRMTGVIIEDSNFQADKIFTAEGPGRKFFESRRPLNMPGQINKKCNNENCPFASQSDMKIAPEMMSQFPGRPTSGLFSDAELLKNKALFSDLVKSEPRFLEYLQKIGISTSTLEELQK